MGFSQFKLKTSSGTTFIDITGSVSDCVNKDSVQEGICLVFVPHTTAGVTINEAADSATQRDISMELNKLVPFQDGYTHAEGNSAAHIKASIVGASAAIPISSGRLMLGTWQGVFFCEFDGPRNRTVYVTCTGTMKN